uniref:Uncharacterized protein n=1 Tax=Myotis lucifugus TaxID=59463 RepID=G1Q0W5_MYOLU
MRETWLNADIMLRTLQVTFQKSCFLSVFSSLQYVSWPDRGVHSYPDYIFAMVEDPYLQGSGPSPFCV